MDLLYLFLTLLFYIFSGSSLLMMMACGYYQLQALNNFLLELSESSDDIFSRRKLKKISIMFDTLCDVFEEISSFFLLNIFFYLIGFVYFNTFCLYIGYILFLSPNYKLVFFLIITLMWVFYYLAPVIWIVTFSSLIDREGIRTADLIQQLSVKCQNLKSLESSEIVMQMVTHRRPKISCGLFDLSWKFFFALLGSIFSFGIILIQFYDVLN